MNNRARVDKKIAEIEATTHLNPEMAAVQAAVVSGYAYTVNTAISADAIEAALFGERMSTLRNELADYKRLNATTRRTNRSVIAEHEHEKELRRLAAKRSSVLSRFRKYMHRDHGVDFMKFTDDLGNTKYCVPLCKESYGYFADKTIARVGRAREQEKIAVSNGRVVGVRYKKIIPDETDA